MKDELVFFQVKNPAQHALTKAGYTTIRSHGKIIVYCTDDGPLDPQYRTQWLEWRKHQDEKP